MLSELRAGRVFVVSPQPGYCPRWLLDNYAFKPAGPVFQKVERRLEVEQKNPPRAAKPLDEPPAPPPAADESEIARDSRFAQRRTTWMSSGGYARTLGRRDSCDIRWHASLAIDRQSRS